MSPSTCLTYHAFAPLGTTALKGALKVASIATFIDNRTYREVEAFAKLHNLDIAEVVRTSLQNFLQKFKVAKPQARAAKYELPEHLKKMRGILAGVEDKDDERLQYLLEKYK